MLKTPVFTGQFKRDAKRAVKRGKSIPDLEAVIRLIVSGEPLPAKYRDHLLTGNWAKRRECHIEPDWLLIYRFEDNGETVVFERTGTHSDLFY